MDKTKELERTEELLHKSLKELTEKGDLNNMSIDLLGKTIDALKDVCEIKGMEEGMSYGRGGMWEGGYGREYGARRGRDGDGDGRYNEGRYRGYEGYGEYGRRY